MLGSLNSLKGLSLQVLKYWPSGEECPVYILCACGFGKLEADKCKAVFSWCWGSEGVVPGGKALKVHWRRSWVVTCGFCAGIERVMGQQWVGDTLQVTPKLAPVEALVSPHLHAQEHAGLLVCSGPLQRTPMTGAHCFLLTAWNQALRTFPLSPFMAAQGNSHVSALPPVGGWDQALCLLHVPMRPLHTLGFQGEFLHQHLWSHWDQDQISRTCINPSPCTLWAALENSHIGTCQVPLVAKCQSHMCVPPKCSGEFSW